MINKELRRFVSNISTKEINGFYGTGFVTCRDMILQKIRELDESDKPRVPKFISDYIKEFKEDDPYPFLANAMDNAQYSDYPVGEWLQVFDDLDGIDEEQAHNNQQLFAEAWIAYPNIEIIKEPEWVIRYGNFYYKESIIEQSVSSSSMRFDCVGDKNKAHKFYAEDVVNEFISRYGGVAEEV